MISGIVRNSRQHATTTMPIVATPSTHEYSGDFAIPDCPAAARSNPRLMGVVRGVAALIDGAAIASGSSTSIRRSLWTEW